MEACQAENTHTNRQAEARSVAAELPKCRTLKQSPNVLSRRHDQLVLYKALKIPYAACLSPVHVSLIESKYILRSLHREFSFKHWSHINLTFVNDYLLFGTVTFQLNSLHFVGYYYVNSPLALKCFSWQRFWHAGAYSRCCANPYPKTTVSSQQCKVLQFYYYLRLPVFMNSFMGLEHQPLETWHLLRKKQTTANCKCQLLAFGLHIIMYFLDLKKLRLTISQGALCLTVTDCHWILQNFYFNRAIYPEVLCRP